MFATKPISMESVPGALAKSERYRLLNEPGAAESICRDILEVDPKNLQARIGLILALTDQIHFDAHAFKRALAEIQEFPQGYERAYYAGVAWERRAKARYHAGGQGAHHYAYEWIVNALHLFEDAERMRPAGNDDAILRWNTCVRFLNRDKQLAPRPEEVREAILSE